MNKAQRILQLAKRDFTQRVRSKAFMISMLLIVGVVLAVGPLIALAEGEDQPSRIAIVGELPDGSEAAIRQQANLLELDITMQQYPDLPSAESALTDGNADVVVNGTTELIFNKEPSLRLSAVITNGVATARRQITAEQMGLSATDVNSLLVPIQMTERTIEPPASEEDNGRQFAAFIVLMMLYISILIFGQFVMMGVMEEKQTRVVEVVLSRVKPTDVLIGKVLGIGLLGLIQIVVLGGALYFTMTVADIAELDLSGIGPMLIGMLILWYLLGYAFYSFMYGSLGATISRQEDMQGVAMLPVLLILPGFFLGQMAMLEPDMTLTRIASLIPVWSPMVMAVRATVGDVPVWEVTLAIVLVVALTVLMVKLGGRIYRGAILQSGKKTKLRTAWKSANN